MQFVFTDRPGLTTAAIRLFDGGPYSHCGIVYTDNHGQSRVVEATFEDGVRERSLSGLLFGKTRWAILQLPLERELYARLWALQQLGKGYDFGALPSLAVRSVFGTAPRWDARDKWYCAEHMLATAVQGGQLLSSPMRRHGVRSSFEQLTAWGAQVQSQR